jgi:hypothetical protein
VTFLVVPPKDGLAPNDVAFLGKNILGWTKKGTCGILDNAFLQFILIVTKM